MAQVAGKVAMYLGDKVLDAIVGKVIDKAMSEMLHEEDKMDTALSELKDISRLIGKNYKMVRPCSAFSCIAQQ